MQWNDEANAGFTKGTPWMRLNDNYKEVNVEAQKQDADSVFSYYKKLIALRKSEEWKEVFVYGEFCPIFEENEKIFAFSRILGKKIVELPSEMEKVLLGNMESGRDIRDTVTLKASEVLVFSLK